MEDEVTKFGIRVALMWIVGILSGVVTLFFVLMAVLVLQVSEGMVFADALILLGAVMFGGSAILAIGLAIKKPVALRLDRHGMSGYYAPDLRWDQIRNVPENMGPGRTIWLELHDPAAHWSRQSRTKRFIGAVNHQAGKVIINTNQFKAPGSDVLDAIRAYHARYGRPDAS